MEVTVENNILLVDGIYLRNPSVQQFTSALQSGQKKILEAFKGWDSRVALAFLGRDEKTILREAAYAKFVHEMHWGKIQRNDLLPYFFKLWGQSKT